MKFGVCIIHRITFSTIQPSDVPAREMQQLAHAAAFLTAVTPPVYLYDVAKDGCWPSQSDDSHTTNEA